MALTSTLVSVPASKGISPLIISSSFSSLKSSLVVHDVLGASKILNCQKGTIYNQVYKKIIPYHKKGKKLYFFKSELIEYIRAGKIKTRSEIKEEVNQQLYDIKNGAQIGQNPKNTPYKEHSKNTEYSLSDKIKVTTISAEEQNENLEDATEETGNLHFLQNEDELSKDSE